MTGFIPDTTQPSRTELLSLLNSGNSKSYTLSQIVFSTIAPSTANVNYNTVVTVTGIPGNGYFNSKVVYYNRIDIGLFFKSTLVLDPALLTGVMMWDILSQINSMLNLQLRQDEVVNEPVNLAASSLTLSISNTSEVWLPGSSVVIALVVPIATYRLLLDTGNGILLDNGTTLTMQ